MLGTLVRKHIKNKGNRRPSEIKREDHENQENVTFDSNTATENRERHPQQGRTTNNTATQEQESEKREMCDIVKHLKKKSRLHKQQMLNVLPARAKQHWR